MQTVINLALEQAFNTAYYLSLSPAQSSIVKAAQTNNSRLYDLANAAVKNGVIVDLPIMVWNWNPYQTMLSRQNFGYTWVPSAGMQGIQLVPGVTFPGMVPYNPLPPYPKGAIVVSTNPADFPPFGTPAPPVVPVTRGPIGDAIPNTNPQQYVVNYPEAASFTNGQTLAVLGHTYKLVAPGIFSPRYWIQVS